MKPEKMPSMTLIETNNGYQPYRCGFLVPLALLHATKECNLTTEITVYAFDSASTSPYRRQLLERLGLPSPGRRPPAMKKRSKTPASTPSFAEHLAIAKASSVADQHPNDTIIGSDQLACVDTTILGKPGTSERAIDQLGLPAAAATN